MARAVGVAWGKITLPLRQEHARTHEIVQWTEA